jgi:hypothetical protein
MEIEAAVAEFPDDNLAPPRDVLLIAVVSEAPVGCVGLRIRSDGVGEVTRLYVEPSRRRCGLQRPRPTSSASHRWEADRAQERVRRPDTPVEARKRRRRPRPYRHCGAMAFRSRPESGSRASESSVVTTVLAVALAVAAI